MHVRGADAAMAATARTVGGRRSISEGGACPSATPPPPNMPRFPPHQLASEPALTTAVTEAKKL